MRDNSDYYTADLALREEIDWILARPHAKIIDWLRPRAANLSTVVEFGCGSGIVAASLKPTTYLGIDANPHFLTMAKKRCVDRDTFAFMKQDVRDFTETKTFDLTMAWSFFKHFSLQEWNSIVACVLVHGKFGCFNVQMFGRDMDDGRDYHHVYVTEARLAEAIRGAGHEEVERLVLKEWEFSGAMAKDVAKDVVVWTKQKETSNATH